MLVNDRVLKNSILCQRIEVINSWRKLGMLHGKVNHFLINNYPEWKSIDS